MIATYLFNTDHQVDRRRKILLLTLLTFVALC